MVGVRVMSTRVCHGGWRNTDSERQDECNPGLGHHDEFLLKAAQFQRLSHKAAARKALSPITAPLPNL